jgi:hypothetical protein
LDFAPDRHSEDQAWKTGRARSGAWRLAVALGVTGLLAVGLGAGCGQGGAVTSYTTMANNLLAQLNQKKIELRNYWTAGIAEQEGMARSLDDFRKTIAACQNLLDTTDSPDACRSLDDLLGSSVNRSRTLADLTTQFSDYLGTVSPMAKSAADIVTQLQSLDKAQYVPTTIAGLAYKAQQLEGSLRSLNPSPNFREINDQFAAFVSLMAKNLAEAQKSLGNSNYVPADESNNDNGDPQDTAPDAAELRQKQREIDQIAQYTDPIVNAWSELNSQIVDELNQIREATGVNSSMVEVENYIGQGVAEIQKLKQQYK